MKVDICGDCCHYDKLNKDCVSRDMEFEVYTNIPLNVKWDKDDMYIIKCDFFRL